MQLLHAPLHCGALIEQTPQIIKQPALSHSAKDITELLNPVNTLIANDTRFETVSTLGNGDPLGEGWDPAPEGCNPCRKIEKFPERSRERFPTDAEFARLAQVLD